MLVVREVVEYIYSGKDRNHAFRKRGGPGGVSERSHTME